MTNQFLSGYVDGWRVYRLTDPRLLRRLPWRREDRDRILAALGAPASVPAVDVRKLREREGLCRRDFCALYGLNPDSVKRWEAGGKPSGCAAVLLALIAAEPAAVRRALGLRW